MRRRFALLGAAALGGCSLLPSSTYVQKRDWPLDVHRASVRPARARGKVLLVREIRAGPGLDVRGMQWQQPDGSVHVDFYEQWAVPPAQAVEDDLRQWLAGSGLFSAVVAPGSRLEADYVLEGELQSFIADPNAGVARVSVAFVLLDQHPSPIKAVLQRTERAEAKLNGSDAPAIAAAMRAAVTEVLEKIETDVARVAR
ncbi:MAG TPA: ABC-type transport auxiliary lipoprotein family protein [Acetobacteraceae bacterium]|jgi:cholesterol transport system auxiliary component|nr:ABC-type transport auxiliary lipoprotein family protein [Acetobacteraceae bacterium]